TRRVAPVERIVSRGPVVPVARMKTPVSGGPIHINALFAHFSGAQLVKRDKQGKRCQKTDTQQAQAKYPQARRQAVHFSRDSILRTASRAARPPLQSSSASH